MNKSTGTTTTTIYIYSLIKKKQSLGEVVDKKQIT